MKKRVISCIVLLTVTLTCLLLGRVTRVVFFAAAGILCVVEMCRNLKSLQIRCTDRVLYLYVAGQTVIQLLSAPFVYSLAWLAFTVYLIFFVGIRNGEVSGKGALASLAVLMYPCVLFSILMAIACETRWLEVLTVACLATWFCDAFALFGGKRFGKHKLAPAVSPNKTVEGSVCGTIAAAAAGLISFFILPLYASAVPLWVCLVTAVVCSALGQIGDLAESLIKRMIGIKDFSNLIPGHGGMLDRADSLLFSIPCAYFFFYLFKLL